MGAFNIFRILRIRRIGFFPALNAGKGLTISWKSLLKQVGLSHGPCCLNQFQYKEIGEDK